MGLALTGLTSSGTLNLYLVGGARPKQPSSSALLKAAMRLDVSRTIAEQCAPRPLLIKGL